MNNNRADSFLRLIRRSQRGKLKIYLGYCAGVGKTYQMLLEGRRLKEDDIQVAVGLVETHGRQETEALLEGLELIPRRRLLYRGMEITEFDLDAVLERRPSVVLVDELAHTNAPGSKNAKRYQDVEEILAAGIHVISTLNVQHLESLYETVERVTHVKVRERIPDRIVAQADQLVNVDITTEDLQRRLREGRVYASAQVGTALANFFQPANLEQLRELTLRELAAQLNLRHRDQLAEELPATPDQVMVCLSSRGPNSEALLRYTSRLAGKLNRNWYAVYVQTESEQSRLLDAETQRILANTLQLAQQLGAAVFTFKSDDVVKTILRFTAEYRVGHIVIGSPGGKPSWRRRWLSGTGIVERLLLESRGLTVVVVDTRPIVNKPATPIEDSQPTDDVGAPSRKPTAAEDWVSLVAGAKVLFWESSTTKADALEQLLAACCRSDPAINLEAALRALNQRELQGVTAIGPDIIIPHARISSLPHPVIAFGVSKAGFSDPANPNPAKIMILLLSPSNHPDEHLRLLASISGMALDHQWCELMLRADSVEDIKELLRMLTQ